MASTYTLSLPPDLDEDLAKVAEELKISKADALKRAILLIKHAAQADKVELTRDQRTREVKLR